MNRYSRKELTKASNKNRETQLFYRPLMRDFIMSLRTDAQRYGCEDVRYGAQMVVVVTHADNDENGVISSWWMKLRRDHHGIS